jgi:hypothetical protein
MSTLIHGLIAKQMRAVGLKKARQSAPRMAAVRIERDCDCLVLTETRHSVAATFREPSRPHRQYDRLWSNQNDEWFE